MGRSVIGVATIESVDQLAIYVVAIVGGAVSHELEGLLVGLPIRIPRGDIDLAVEGRRVRGLDGRHLTSDAEVGSA